MDLTALFRIVEAVGLPGAIAAACMWAFWRMSERMSLRINALEDFTRAELVAIAKNATAAIVRSTEVLDQRPCINGALKQACRKDGE